MPTLKQLAVDSLTHLAEAGQVRLPVDDEARAILRRWMLDARRQPAPAAGMSVEEKLAYLRQRTAAWKPAQQAGTLRSTPVHAAGDPHARLMLVGGAPGYADGQQGEPFAGAAGQLITRILGAMGLQRGAVYITHVCKFRPAIGENQGTDDRPPAPDELAVCLPLVMAEIRAVSPACIVCLGSAAAGALLGTPPREPVPRGMWAECQGVPVRVTEHPAYLLRDESLSARRALWEDMLAVMELLQMPISAKQRGYFTC